MRHERFVDPKLLTRARELRHSQTTAENLLWSFLRDRQLGGFKFRRQHVIERYVLDFYCHSAKLAVEIDGALHNSDDARKHDARRTATIEKRGIRVIRFWNNEVYDETETVLEVIYRTLVPDRPSIQGSLRLTRNEDPHP